MPGSSGRAAPTVQQRALGGSYRSRCGNGAAEWGVGERDHGEDNAGRLFSLDLVLFVLNARNQLHADAVLDDDARDPSAYDELYFAAVDDVDVV